MKRSASSDKRSYEQSRSDAPRRVRNGIKLRSREAPTATNWVAQRWEQLMLKIFDPEVLAEGFTYARSGQTAALVIEAGRITSRVQGRAPKPYPQELSFAPLTADQWETVIAAMAGGAIYVARLLSGEMPPNLDDLFASHGLQLIPGDPTSITKSCTCAEPKPCKHMAAVFYLLLERFNDTPLLVFTLQGLPAEQLLQRLRQARAIHTHGIAAAHADPQIPESQIEPTPLEACLDEYWRPGPQLAELEKAPPPQHVAHALLRRLGPSPMQGRFPMVGLLASIYDTVTEHAIRIRDHAEHIDGNSDNNDEGTT